MLHDTSEEVTWPKCSLSCTSLSWDLSNNRTMYQNTSRSNMESLALTQYNNVTTTIHTTILLLLLLHTSSIETASSMFYVLSIIFLGLMAGRPTVWCRTPQLLWPCHFWWTPEGGSKKGRKEADQEVEEQREKKRENGVISKISSGRRKKREKCS